MMIRLVQDYEEADIIKAKQRLDKNLPPSDWEIDFFIDVHPFLNAEFRSFSMYGITTNYERIKQDFDKIKVKVKTLEEFSSLVEDFSTYLEWMKADGVNFYYWDNDMELLVKDFVSTFLSLQHLDEIFRKQLEEKIFNEFLIQKIWIVEHKSWRTTIEEIAESLYSQGQINTKLQLPLTSSKILLTKVLRECRLNLHDHTKALYKYLTIDAAKKVLLNNTFKYSSPLTFNDPFEFNSELINFSLADKTKLIEQVKLGFIAAGINDLPWIRKRVLDDLIEGLNEDWRKLLDDHRKDSRVLCLSETNSETLMWSHYASGHTGICLGIKIPPMNNIWNVETLKVAYLKKLVVKSFFADNEVEKRKAYLRLIFVKSKHWAYEKEVRINFHYKKPISLFTETDEEENSVDTMTTFVPFEPEQLCEIYYGALCSQKDILDIEEILRLKGYYVKRGKMEKESKTFNLKINYL